MIMQLKHRAFSYEEVGGTAAIAHPKLAALYDLWNLKRDTRQAPPRSDFSVDDLRPWLGHLMVLDVLPDGDFRYRLYGTALVSMFGFDLTGRLVSECDAFIGDKPLLEYRQVCRIGAPVHAARISPSAREHLRVDKLALPLMEGGVVTKILGALYLSDEDD
jgi:hypothetical protein